MHLLQDTSVPDHVRNSAHPEDAIFGKNPFTGSAYFESWAKNNYLFINTLAANPIFPTVSFNVSYNGLAPTTQLFDAEIYNGTNPSTGLTQGLSEYTNANFFSNSTIFAAEIYQASDRHYFPYPKKTSTDLQSFIAGSKAYETITAEDGNTDKAYWISKTADGETIKHFLRARYFTNIVYNLFGEGPLYYSTFYRDEKCHEDYASLLIPRAVGYSAGLLNYFFRGAIDISLPSSGIYSVIDPTQPGFDPSKAGFTSIKLKATNTTTTGENMTNGTIQLVVKYKVAQADPFHSTPVAISPGFSYIVAPEKNNVSSLYIATPTELNFDLSQNPIPLWATDVYLQVVFKGTLGAETNAVAVGFKDISEPTPLDIFNNMDKICILGQWYTAGSVEAYNALPISAKGWDYWAHDLTDEYDKISPISNPSNASPTNFTFYTPLINAGTLHRLYVLTDYDFSESGYGTMAKKDPNDTYNHTGTRKISLAQAMSGIRNQEDYSTDSVFCSSYGLTAPCTVRRSPLFYTFRGVDMWGPAGYIVDGVTYPNNSPCPWSALP